MREDLGDIGLDLGEDLGTWVARPDFRFYATLEERQDQGVREIAEALLLRPRVSGVAAILQVAIESEVVATGSREAAAPSVEEVGQALVALGFDGFLKDCHQLLSWCFVKGKQRAEETEEEEEPESPEGKADEEETEQAATLRDVS